MTNNNPTFSISDKIGIGEQLQKWLRTGVVIGPYDMKYAQRHNVTLNMLFGIPKPDTSTRPILNMSDKSKIGYSVNDKLDPKLCTVEYAQTKQVVETVKALGIGAWLWAKDLKDGYYNVQVHKSDVPKLGFIFEGKIYLFERLPMGLSSSPKIFTDFMNFPVWAIKNNKPDIYYVSVPTNTIDLNNFISNADVKSSRGITTIAIIFYYLDDILGGHPNETVAWQQFHHSESILKLLSLKTKESKAKPPAQTQKWLGKLYDTVRQWLSLPPDKVEQYVSDLQRVINMRSIKKRYLLSHIGRTRHMASIYRPLAAFARNLEVWAYKCNHLDHHIRITAPLRKDLKLCIWGMQRAAQYGISFDQFLKPMDIPDITIHTDASLLIGIGGISDKGHWFQNKWSDVTIHNSNMRDIVWRELVAIYVMIYSLRNECKNKVLHVYTDNEGCKYMLINMRCDLRRPDLQAIINEICKICIEYAIIPWFEHIPGKDNVIADALSRYKPNPFNSAAKYNKQINTTAALQYASDLCRDIAIKPKLLNMADT